MQRHPAFPDAEQGFEREALNCIRILTRILPFIYEAEHLEEWEEKFFWSTRRKRSRRSEVGAQEIIFDGDTTTHEAQETAAEFYEAKPLAEELIDGLFELLFFSSFTVPPSSAKGRGVSLTIWQTGVGCNSAVATSPEMEERRMEVLRLLLTLASKSMYTTSSRWLRQNMLQF